MKKMIGLIMASFLIVGVAAAQKIISSQYDESPAFRVYNGYTGTLTYVVGSDTTFQTNTITCDGLANTVICGGTGTNSTIALLAGNVAGCTNTSLEKKLIVNAEPSLAADATTGKLLAGTYTATSGQWLEILWDTSACLFYNVYLPSHKYYPGVGAYRISKIMGDPTGTGNVTLNVYVNGTKVDQQNYTSPVYVWPQTLLTGGTNTNTNTLGTVNYVNIDYPFEYHSLGAQPVIIRATRATTATTGMLSVLTTSE